MSCLKAVSLHSALPLFTTKSSRYHLPRYLVASACHLARHARTTTSSQNPARLRLTTSFCSLISKNANSTYETPVRKAYTSSLVCTETCTSGAITCQFRSYHLCDFKSARRISLASKSPYLRHTMNDALTRIILPCTPTLFGSQVPQLRHSRAV